MDIRGTHKRQVMSSSTLRKDKVVNPKGEDLGKIEDIMIHVPSGKVAYAVLSFGGILGLGDKLFAIPWQAMSLDEDQKYFILDVSKGKLKEAEGFDKDNWPDMDDPDWGMRVHDFYGTRPYWK